VDKKILVCKYTAVKRLVLTQLEYFLSINADVNHFITAPNQNIPLYKGRDDNKILYISGIALQISKSQNFSAIILANAFLSHFVTNCHNEFDIQVVSPAWIHLQIKDFFLADWLQQMMLGSGDLVSRLSISPSSSFFQIQYAYARCCSLLRLGHQEKVIQLQYFQENIPLGIIFPSRIPWLDSSQKLYFSHPSSFNLLSELINTIDDIDCFNDGNEMKWERVASKLSNAFFRFWDDCQIFGEHKRKSLELSQAYLGLIFATQSVLRFLLEHKLGIRALVEL
jgi:DALR anticodon binding domain